MIPTPIETPRGRFAALEWGRALGDGAPIVVALHGFPDTPRSYAAVAAALVAHGHRVVAPYLRGYFPSPIVGPFDLDSLALDTVATIRAVSPNAPVTLVGHDWGAAVGYAVAQHHGAHLHALVTLAVPHPMTFLRALARSSAQRRRSAYMALFQARGLAEWIVARDDFALIERLWRTWSPDYTLPPDALRALKACLRASMPGPLGHYRAMAWPPLEAFARARAAGRARIATPTLHLQGDRDGCIALAACEGEAAHFAGPFELRAVAGAGHFLPLERPALVADAIVAWSAQARSRKQPA